MNVSKNVREFKRWCEILSNDAAKNFTDKQYCRGLNAMGCNFVDSSDKEKLALTLLYPELVEKIISKFYTFTIEAGELS